MIVNSAIFVFGALRVKLSMELQVYDGPLDWSACLDHWVALQTLLYCDEAQRMGEQVYCYVITSKSKVKQKATMCYQYQQVTLGFYQVCLAFI